MKKHKILMLSDHPLSTSGVGVQARWLIEGLIKTGRYSFRCFGGAVKHEDYRTVVVNEDFVIKPTDGFGDPNMLRQALAIEKPDAIFLFTDPRFFYWVWEMEDEIHQVCPIVYNHLWDNDPAPEFNKVLYESTDLINCINYPTYEMVHKWLPERTNYIPHAVPFEIYKPFSREEAMQHKRRLIGDNRADHFIGLYVGRNARRKMVNDIIASWKIFLDELQQKHGHRKATLVMHTDPLDKEGSNLYEVVNMYGITDNVVYSQERIGFDMMNMLYNISDVQLNRSCNEGFGVPILEGKLAGVPAISIKTGGLTRQLVDHQTGEHYGVGLDPEVRVCTGNQAIPYIYEDFVSNKTFSDAIMKIYDLSPEEKATMAQKCRVHAERDYRMDSLISKWDETLQTTFQNWRQNYKPWSIKEV
jgi:glycosyltransferase involved in cell wall biosynthesis